MSVAATTSVKVKAKAAAPHGSGRTRDLVSALRLHWAGVGLLGLVNLYLLVNMAIAFQQVKSHDADALARQQVELKTAQIAAKPLQGLDVKLGAANANADQFYHVRLPVTYSEVATELGQIAKKQRVRLARVQYAQNAVDGDVVGQLTEVRMDASLSGDYRSLVLLVNELERDKLFFLITGVTLTGQQTGTVNLRIRLTTYLRGLGAEEEMRRGTLNGMASADGNVVANEAAAEGATSSGRAALIPVAGGTR